jgi:succinate dehydrogenase (ubiquinone) cytochrome b560 subunit
MSGTLLASMLCRRGACFNLNLLKANKGITGLNSSVAKWLTTSTSIQQQPTAKLDPAEDFWSKNKRFNRPMSPHLTIYKLQITSVLSVTHRGTGLALSGLTSMFAIGMLMASQPFPAYIAMLQSSHLGPALLFSAKFILAYPLAFHFLNGIRHLAWDFGKGFELKTLNATGWSVVIGSFVLSFLAALM